MRKSLLPAVVLLACACALAATAARTLAADGLPPGQTEATGTATSPVAALPAAVTRTAQAVVQHRAAVNWLGGQIASYQHATWKWQRLMGKPLTETEGRALGEMSIPDIKGAVRLWQLRAVSARKAASHPPNLRAWLCIHRYEGSWTDGGAPFYGGLQMDYGFMARYGGVLLRTKGTADNWSPLEQIWVAERARSSGRGFYPWPNTARYCGLI
jgi:hypothetical protein